MGNSIKYEYDIHNLFSKMIDDMIEARLDNSLGDWYDLGPNHPGVAQLTPIDILFHAFVLRYGR